MYRVFQTRLHCSLSFSSSTVVLCHELKDKPTHFNTFIFAFFATTFESTFARWSFFATLTLFIQTVSNSTVTKVIFPSFWNSHIKEILQQKGKICIQKESTYKTEAFLSAHSFIMSRSLQKPSLAINCHKRKNLKPYKEIGYLTDCSTLMEFLSLEFVHVLFYNMLVVILIKIGVKHSFSFIFA